MAARGGGSLPGYAAAAISVVAGLALLAVLKSLDAFDTAAFIALLVLPILAYAVFSGAVTEISAPGGWGAKFRSAARRAVDIDNEIEPVSVIDKGTMPQLQARIDNAPPKGAIALQFVCGYGPEVPIYDEGAIYEYLRLLERIDPKMVLVIIDPDKRFRASTDAVSLKRLQSLDNLMSDFLRYLREEDFTGIRTLLPLTSQALRRGASNGAALNIMLADGVETLVVTDEFARPMGVIRRDRIVARLMAELAEE